MSAKPVQTVADTDDVIVIEEPAAAASAVVVESSDDDDDIAEVVQDSPAAAAAPADAVASVTVAAVTTVDLESPVDAHKSNSTTIPVADVVDVETETSMDVGEVSAPAESIAPTIAVIDSAPDVQKPKASVDTSLGLLAGYGSGSEGSDEDDDDDDEDGNAAIVVAPIAGKASATVSRETHAEATKKLDQFLEGGDYRVISDSSEEDDSDDDSDVGVSSVGGTAVRRVRIDDDDDSDVEIVSKSREYVKAKGELGIDDLPPIEDLKITVPEDECILLGKIFSIVEQLVIVDSVPGAAPLDLETVLFLDKGTNALGRVFDVLGQISEPLYCVRFNSNEEILAKGITVGTPVFVAPRTEHTIFVILGNLQREKGCDASWEHDVEPPSRCMEYSDDEEERNARKVRRGKKTAEADVDGEAEGGDGTEGQKRQRNTSMTASEASAAGGPSDNWRQQSSQLPGGRFQRGGGRGGQRGARGGRGGFRGQSHNQQQPQQQQQHQHHQQSNQAYGGGYQQQQQANNWSNPRDNYSWHTNLPYNGGPAMQRPPQQQQQHQQPPPPHAYYAQPPPPPQHMYQYGAPNGAPAGYPYQPHPVTPMAYGGYAAPPPVPQMYGAPAAHFQPPPPGYQQSPPPPLPHQQQQQQHQQQPPPHGRN